MFFEHLLGKETNFGDLKGGVTNEISGKLQN